mmetsp:Transcript_31661/g.39020  ORF Transcript_31661/g.39020 Transcript_31661/m.39020 type:complete len:282 (-) Transcript_31661:431-1276(-)
MSQNYEAVSHKHENGNGAHQFVGFKHVLPLPHTPGKKKPKIHVCICGTKACKDLTHLLSYKYLGHARGGVTTLPIGNKAVDKFRRKRWQEYLGTSIADQDKRRFRVSRAHFKEEDMERAATGGWGIKRWATAESNIEEDKYPFDQDDKTTKWKTITVPLIGPDEMLKEYHELINNQKQLLIPTKLQKKKMEHVMDLTRSIVDDLTACRSSQMALTLQSKSRTARRKEKEKSASQSIEEDAKFAEFHIHQSQKYVMSLIAKLTAQEASQQAASLSHNQQNNA